MKSDRARVKLMLALGSAILVGAFLLLVLSPAEGLLLNASGRVLAIGPPLPSQLPVGRPAPTRPPLKLPPPRTGFIPPPVDLSHLKADKIPEGVKAAALPGRWDWRDLGAVTSVKNQGSCGSCYAFAAIGNFESNLLIDGAGSYDFSENHAKECNWQELNDYRYPPGTPWGSCAGGNYFMLASLFSQKGTVLESCDPYVASDVDCNDTCSYEKTLLDWRIISGDAVPDTEVLKSYIFAAASPVYTSIYAGDGDAWQTEFGNYDGSYTLHHPGTEATNHTVLIVGWDDSLTHAGGTGGWIVKNSWGTDWGDNGYFYIAYGSASIGMHSSFVHAWQDYDPDGDIMYYDEAGWMGWSWGYEDTTGWGLCKFILASNTYVTRVEFWTTDATTDVDVYIYDDFDGMALSNPLWSSLDHSFNEAGYHGVAVDPPLVVTEGDDVVAVVAFTNQSYQYPIPIDVDGPNETLRTYVSPSGSDGSWYNLGAGAGEDVAIRLRTSGIAVPPTPTVTPTPSGFKVYLPLIVKNYAPGAPTPTPTPTPTVTPMNTPGPGVGAARGRILWNDEGASGAYSRLCQDLESGTCSGRQYDTTTDASGWYEFTDVVPDSYCHLVRLAGEPVWWYKSFLFGCSEITISAGKITRIDDFHVAKTDLALLSPPDDSTLDTNQPTLVWAAYPSAAYYKVYLRRESPSPETILDYVRVDGTALTVADPLYGGEYRWSVNAYNANDRQIAYSYIDYHFTVPGSPAPTPTPTPLPTPPPGTDVHVTNSTTFAPYEGSTSTYLVGEMYNASDVSVGFVKIYATFYDAEGSVVDEGWTYACIHHLAPEMSSPFSISFYNLPASSWDHYELHLTWRTTAYTPLPMEVSNVSDFFDEGNAFHVTGDVRNQYDRQLGDIKACVAMHDAAGDTIGVWWDSVGTLGPDETDSFDVKVSFWKHKPDRGELADYSLQVYNEYESVTATEQEKLCQARDEAAELATQMRADWEAHR